MSEENKAFTAEMGGPKPGQILVATQSQAVAKAEALSPDEELQKFLFYGDLSSLSKGQQNDYVFRLSKSMGLNPWTRPFDMIVLNGKLTVYTNKGAAAQLRDLRHISLKKVYAGALRMGEGIQNHAGCYEVEIEASIPDEKCEGGFRRGVGVGTVTIADLQGEALSNAVMKCWTKAERRSTLAISGIAFPDETEVASIPQGGPDAPQRRTPRPLPAATKAPEPALPEPRSETVVVAGEVVNTKTGEIVDAIPVEKPATSQTSPAPPVQASAQTALPSRGKYPPAVAPVGIK